jgi:hypothetical protein
MKTYKVEVTDKATIWYNESNELHREEGPAIEYANGGKSYYINGERHREDEFKSCENKIVEIEGVKYKLTKV